MPKTPKRPADMMQLARLIGERATGETSEAETDPAPKPAAKRGEARAAKLTPKKRSAIAKAAATARWNGARKE
ncbi:MAG: histone H1 [Gemmatimonadaceae bacterium]